MIVKINHTPDPGGVGSIPSCLHTPAAHAGARFRWAFGEPRRASPAHIARWPPEAYHPARSKPSESEDIEETCT